MFGSEISRLRQRIGRFVPAVVILIEVLELDFGQRVEIDALGGEFRQDLVLVDRMRVVEVDDRLP